MVDASPRHPISSMSEKDRMRKRISQLEDQNARFVLQGCDWDRNHEYAMLDGKKTRCPECLAIGLDTARVEVARLKEELQKGVSKAVVESEIRIETTRQRERADRLAALVKELRECLKDAIARGPDLYDHYYDTEDKGVKKSDPLSYHGNNFAKEAYDAAIKKADDADKEGLLETEDGVTKC